jgi:hypothetical protein
VQPSPPVVAHVAVTRLAEACFRNMTRGPPVERSSQEPPKFRNHPTWRSFNRVALLFET